MMTTEGRATHGTSDEACASDIAPSVTEHGLWSYVKGLGPGLAVMLVVLSL